jgi:hypothetical protein
MTLEDSLSVSVSDPVCYWLVDNAVWRFVRKFVKASAYGAVSSYVSGHTNNSFQYAVSDSVTNIINSYDT